jgi:SNF2 family DNA or RNA helicase
MPVAALPRGVDQQVDALRPYQQHGVRWLRSATSINPHRFLVFEAGLGKTRVAIQAAYEINAQNVLVICPAVARIVWTAELDKWWPKWPAGRPPALLVVESGHANRYRFRDVPRPGWTVIGYPNLSMKDNAWIKVLAAKQWDLLIIDECQYLKGSSNRTHAVYGKGFAALPGSLAGAADRVWLLSGTPAPNHAGELFPHINALFKEILPPGVRHIWEFEDRFCNVSNTVFGRRISGSNVNRLADLRTRLGPYVLRRRQDDVLKELPPMAFYDTPIDAKITPINNRVVDAKDDDHLIRALRAEETNLATDRRELGESKVPGAVAFCEELLTEMRIGQQKLVCFAYHKAVIAGLAAGLRDWDPQVLDGSTSQRERAAAIYDFTHNQHNANVFIGQIQAAGTAITLTSASVCVFVEVSWVPGENYQAAMRVHRLGQRRACAAYFLYVPGSLDQRIMGAYRRKAGQLLQLWDRR